MSTTSIAENGAEPWRPGIGLSMSAKAQDIATTLVARVNDDRDYAYDLVRSYRWNGTKGTDPDLAHLRWLGTLMSPTSPLATEVLAVLA